MKNFYNLEVYKISSLYNSFNQGDRKWKIRIFIFSLINSKKSWPTIVPSRLAGAYLASHGTVPENKNYTNLNVNNN